MNQFLFYLQGRLLAPGFFDIRIANSANDGRVAILTVGSDKIGEELAEIGIDVLEVRASNVVRRFRYDHALANAEPGPKGETPTYRLHPAVDDAPSRHEFRAMGVPNEF